MRKPLFWAVVAVSLSAQSALSNQGDSAAHIKAQNAICEQQKRGEIPREPDMCLPSLPPDYYHVPPPRR